MQRVPKSEGCALSGFVLVKKVPGTLHFLPKSAGHSFDYHAINMSHQVGYMYYGNKPSPRRRQVRPIFSNECLNEYLLHGLWRGLHSSRKPLFAMLLLCSL